MFEFHFEIVRKIILERQFQTSSMHKHLYHKQIEPYLMIFLVKTVRIKVKKLVLKQNTQRTLTPYVHYMT